MHLEWKRGEHRIFAGKSQSLMLASQRSIGRYFGATGLLVLTCSVILAVFYGGDSLRPIDGGTVPLKVASSDHLPDRRPGMPEDGSAAPVKTKGPETAVPLPDGEKEAFFHEIGVVFGSLSLVTLDPAVIAPHLSRLNERGQKGLITLVQTLGHPAQSDRAIKERMHLIDYLNYRMKWDPVSQSAAMDLIQRPIPEGTPLRYQATTIIEKAELLAGLAPLNREETASILRAMPEGRPRRIALNAVRDALINSGLTVEEVETQFKQL